MRGREKMNRAKELILITLLCAAIGAAVTGLFLLINNRQNHFKQLDAAQCAKIAKLAGVTEHYYDGYTCYLVKGNKLERVEL